MTIGEGNRAIWFGTANHMEWVKAPSSNADWSRVGWSSGTTTMLNGGAALSRSRAAHGEYHMSWGLSSYAELEPIMKYAQGAYDVNYDNPQLVYFVDPLAAQYNIAPTSLGYPALAAADGPSLIYGTRPTLEPTPTNTLNLPAQTAVYNLLAGDVTASIYIPCPPGHYVFVSTFGSATGTAQLLGNGNTLNMSTTTLSGAPMIYTNPVTITMTGVGQLHLTAIQIQIWKNTADYNVNGAWHLPMGNQGCLFDGQPSINLYSAAIPGAQISMTADLIETGAWLTQ